jgi:electron transport complex protein RnfG
VLGTSITRNSVLLGLFAVVTAGMLAAVNESTKERIAQEVRIAQQRALYEIVPQHRVDNDLLMDTQPIPNEFWRELGLPSGGDLHLARHGGDVVALIIPAVAPDGYSGEISLIVGVNRDGSVAGVRVLSHKETPGLGDKLELNKGDWILSFDGTSLQNPQASGWKVKKDGGEFDQFTGATITPRAVVHQVKRVLDFVAAHEAELFGSELTAPAAPAANPASMIDASDTQGVTYE